MVQVPFQIDRKQPHCLGQAKNRCLIQLCGAALEYIIMFGTGITFLAQLQTKDALND